MSKPNKPYPTYPLFAHANGQWAKKIKTPQGRKLFYFGKWDDPVAAVEKYRAQVESLTLGIKPVKSLEDAKAAFREEKWQSVLEGSIQERTFEEYMQVVSQIDGLSREHLLQLRKRLGLKKDGGQLSPIVFGNRLTQARMFVAYCIDNFEMESKGYKKILASPPRRAIRQQQNKYRKMFEPSEVRALLQSADPHLKAFIWLGVYGGFTCADACGLQPEFIQGSFYETHREKTQVHRRFYIPPEALESVEAIGCEFNGRQWSRHIFALELRKLCRELDIYKPNITTPHTFRRTAETILKNSPINQSITDKMLGHEGRTMGDLYCQQIADSSLIQASELITEWLGGQETPPSGSAE